MISLIRPKLRPIIPSLSKRFISSFMEFTEEDMKDGCIGKFAEEYPSAFKRLLQRNSKCMLKGLQHVCELAFEIIRKMTYKLYTKSPSKCMLNCIQNVW